MNSLKTVEQIKLFLQALGTIDETVADHLASYCTAFLIVDTKLQQALDIFLIHSADEMREYLQFQKIPEWVSDDDPKVKN